MPAASSDAPRAAFRTLYEQHYAFVWGVLRRLGVPERDVEDLLQDVFVVVHRRLDDFEGRAANTTWLYAIAVRVYWNYARRQQRRPTLATESASAMPILDDSVGPERFAQHREASALLEELLGSLDPDKRTAFVLAELEGLSAPEIAEVTGTKTRTVYSRIRAAKQLVEASAKRVQARERNDVSVRRVARATARPPAGLERRAWAALLVRLPELAPASALTGWFAAKVAVAVLGIGAVGAVAASWVEPTPSVMTVAPVPKPEPEPEPVALASTTPPPTPAPSVEPELPELPAPAPARSRRVEPPNELALLQQARQALKDERPTEALRLLDRHRTRHPNSQLARERQRTRLSALCALGRAKEAAAEADAHDLPHACDDG